MDSFDQILNIFTLIYDSEELPGLHPVISAFRDSKAWRNNRVRTSPKWLENAQTNHSVAFSLSAFPKTLCPIFPTLYSLFCQPLRYAQHKKTLSSEK